MHQLLIFLVCWVVFSVEHAKKIVLVGSRILDQIKEKDVYEHEKHSHSVVKVTSATNLDIECIVGNADVARELASERRKSTTPRKSPSLRRISSRKDARHLT